MIPVLHEYQLASGVRAFSTTRQGGVSEGAYASFNINAYCGDDPACLEANLASLARELGLPRSAILMPHQVHGEQHVCVEADFLSKSDEQQADLLDGVDIIMTPLRQVCVGVSTADCVPVLLYDEVRGVVCAVHAGWRGTVVRVTCQALRVMAERYHTEPAQVTAVIGPCISLEAFEVGDEVYARFQLAGFDMPSISRKDSKWHIDLPECNRQQLVSMGVRAENIQVSGICTYTHSDRFFSARKLGTFSGRIYSGIFRL